MLDWRATWRELEPPPWLAMLPLGSVEQHGPHLPLGTDWVLAESVAREAARVLDAWLLPTQPFSCAQEHQDFPGTISLRPATLAAFLGDVVASLGRGGVPRLAIVNLHGGNWALKSIVRDLNRQQREVAMAFVNPYEGIPGLDVASDLHSGAFETSLMLHLAPNHVRRVDCDFVPDARPERLDQVGIRALSPGGNWGRPSQATRERGVHDFTWMVEETVRRIQQTFA